MTRDDKGSTTERDAGLWEAHYAEPDTDTPTRLEAERDEADMDVTDLVMPFCVDCPDHEACATGWSCWKVKEPAETS